MRQVRAVSDWTFPHLHDTGDQERRGIEILMYVLGADVGREATQID